MNEKMKTKKTSTISVDKIKDAALHLFAIKGYSYTSLEEIANEAGFTKGAVYYHFKSKKRLILEILNDIKYRSIDLTTEKISFEKEKTKDLLVHFFKSQADWAAKHPDDVGVLIMMSVSFTNRDSDIYQKIEEFYTKLTQVLTDIMSLGVRKGEISKDININDAVTYMIAAHDGNQLHWYRSGRDPEVGRNLVKSVVDILIHPIIFD
jgi:AcrR family transcriptional regulator